MAAGYRSFEAFWEGGASSPSGTPVGGYTSLVAPWLGGASSPPIGGTGGYTSLLAFWLGGASALSGGVVIPPSPGGGSTGRSYPIRYRRQRQEEYQDYLAEDYDLIILLIKVIAESQ